MSVGWLLVVAIAGVATALSPVPVIASLRMVQVDRGITLAGVFLAGWVMAVSLLSYVFVLLISGFLDTAGNVTWARFHLAAFVVLVVLGSRLVVQLRSRQVPAAPRWLDDVGEFTVPRTLGVGFSLAVVSPRIVIFSIVAMSALVEGHLAATALLVYVVISAAGLTFAPLLVLVGGRKTAYFQPVAAWWSRRHISIALSGVAVVALSQALLIVTAIARD